MDTKDKKSTSGHSVKKGIIGSKTKDAEQYYEAMNTSPDNFKLLIKAVPMEALLLSYVPTTGDMLQKADSKGLENITIATTTVPEYEFNCIKLFLIDTNKESVAIGGLILDINEESRELYKIIAATKEMISMEHLVTKTICHVKGWQEQVNLHKVVGEVSNQFIFNKITAGLFVSEEEDITCLIDEEKEESIRITKNWLSDEGNKKMLLHRARIVDKMFKKRGYWFTLEQFCASFKVRNGQAIDELNLLKLAGHLVAKYVPEAETEIYQIVFTDKQLLDKLQSVEKTLLNELETVRLQMAEIKSRSN